MSVFSPLALTQALPFLPLAQGDIDYEVSRRDEPDLFDTVLLEPATKVILVKDGMVAVPRGQGAIADYANVHMRLAQLPGAYVATELHAHPTALAIFLGSYGGNRDEHVVAVDVSRVQAEEPVAASSEHMGADDAFGEQREPEEKTSKSLLENAAERFDWVDLRGFAPHASAREAGQATTAISLGVWHARQRHCPTCGAPTEPALGGWAQRMANGCCSPEWSRPLSRRSWIMRIVCYCSTTVHGAIPACIPCPQASWRRVRTWSTHAVVKPKRRSASNWANSNIWDRSHGHSQPRS